MTLQEIIKSIENLSVNEQDSLLDILVKQRQEKQESLQNYVTNTNKILNSNEESFWDMTLRFRQEMERESIEFNDEDFANLRDINPGQEVEFEL